MRKHQCILKKKQSIRSVGLAVKLVLIVVINLPTALFAQKEDSTVTRLIVDYNKTTDFSRFKTYKFEIAKVMTDQGLLEVSEDMAIKQLVELALANQLTLKGLTLNEGNPDLLIRYISGIRARTQTGQENQATRFKYWETLDWYKMKRSQWREDENKQSTLSIDLVDAIKGDMIWSVYCIGNIQKTDSDSALIRTVEKAFFNYPPKIKKAVKADFDFKPK